MKLAVEEVACRQLESAIWMYAYDFDEPAVHLLAGTAFELYTEVLGLGSYETWVAKYIKPEKRKEYEAGLKKATNFFKHGPDKHRGKSEDVLDYNPAQVEIILFLACEANVQGSKKFRLPSAVKYISYFFLKHPDAVVVPHNEEIRNAVKEAQKVGFDPTNREMLKIMLDSLKSPIGK